MKDNENKAYYNDFAGWYENERHHGYHAMLDELELDIIRPLARGAKVLEVGCGTGLIMKGLEDTARSMVGLDISPGMLEEARSRGFEVVEGSAEDLPFEDSSFDLVYSFKVLAHVQGIEQAMSEMSRVLRPGGYLVAEFYNSLSIRNVAKRLGGPGKISAGRTEAEVFTRWDTPRQVRGYIPSGMTFEGWRGVRVFTPAAAAHKIPGLGNLLSAAERRSVDSPLARFGGFLVAVCRKSG